MLSLWQTPVLRTILRTSEPLGLRNKRNNSALSSLPCRFEWKESLGKGCAFWYFRLEKSILVANLRKHPLILQVHPGALRLVLAE